MKQFKLSGSLRENVGRQDASALRHAGRIPGVLYGGTDQVHFSVGEIEMNKIMAMSDTLQIELTLGEKTYSSILQEVQREKNCNIATFPIDPTKSAISMAVNSFSDLLDNDAAEPMF